MRGFERRRFPEFKRLRRLHIVMAVNEKMGALAGRGGVLARTMGCPLVVQSSACRPTCSQRFTTHSAQVIMSSRCCGWAETLGEADVIAQFVDESRFVLL